MKLKIGLVIGAALLLATGVYAKPSVPQAVVPPAQAQAFAIGYVLRTSDILSETFIHSVVHLKTIDNEEQASDEVENLNQEVRPLRRAQALAYGRLGELLFPGLGAAQDDLRVWAIQSELRLSNDLVYSAEEKKLARADSSTATILAELDELQALKAAATANQPSLLHSVKTAASAPGLWAMEMGRYAASLDAETLDASDAPLPREAVTRHLMETAPAGTPRSVRAGLASLLPHGGGNLQSLATVPPPDVPVQKLSKVYQSLVTAFDARKLADSVGKGMV